MASIPPFPILPRPIRQLMPTLGTSAEGMAVQEKFLEAISANFVPVPPTLESVTEGLMEAWRRTDDVDTRIAAAEIDLPRSWDDVFEPQVPNVMQMIDEGRRTFRFDPSATRTSGGASSICMTPSRARASAGAARPWLT